MFRGFKTDCLKNLFGNLFSLSLEVRNNYVFLVRNCILIAKHAPFAINGRKRGTIHNFIQSRKSSHYKRPQIS